MMYSRPRHFTIGELATLFIVLLTLASTLAGCGSSGSSTTTNPTLTYWHLWTDKFYGGIQDDLVHTFNKTQPGFTVNPQRQGDTSKFLSTVSAGNPPDVYMVPTGPIQLAVQGALMPLDNYVKDSKVIKQSDFWPGAWATCTYHGHIYCIPYVYDSFALFWNKDLFKAAGLDPNKPPTTWAELETYTQKLTKRDSKGAITQLGFAPWIGSTSAAEWPMWADGSQMWNYQTGTPTMDQAGNAAALQWEVDWAKKFGGYDQLQRFNSSFSGNTNFLGQKVAMWVGESYYLSSLQQFEPNVNFGVASFGVPRPDASHPYINGSVDGNMLAIPTGSKHPDQAWKFIEWNATTGVRDWVTREGDLSARKADITVQPTVLKEPYRSDYKIFADLLRGSNIFYNQGSPVDLYYYTERDNQFDLARRGAKSPEQALKDLQTGVQAQLTKALAHYHG
ncbi:ABC transporter substrate-binding protein [Dictyobacter formicarum]|uniref:Sugar ABC transporter substrate-binding protein n=1 Tax=Dictyobacter formicarum TaxID=2778368 RepID=A0ABQ3VW09_9CHLR|nr:ABC transporter substrate-binding protein [Dictyobacter formicarum]GHO89814.1 sugar ABC transporter substrate-binding protein [Dictyobacter formicarum]